MFQLCVLASGSKGNCSVVKTNSTKILVDAGLSGKRIIELLENLELDAKKINAVLISHEHSDHIKGAGIICRKLNIPLYITRQTYMVSRVKIGKIPNGVRHFLHGEKFVVGDIVIDSIPTQHDAVEGSNFTFIQNNNKNRKLAIVTDLGYPSRLLLQKLKDVTTILLESNHDLKMLLNGSYPWELKQRVKSREGHLSNEQAVGIVSKIAHNDLKNIVLAHLSEENNCPQKAYNLMSELLDILNMDINLRIAEQNNPISIINI